MIMEEKTLVLLKPDVTKRNLVGKVLDYFEKNDLKISRMRSVKYPSIPFCQEHYWEHKYKDFFASTVEFLHSGLVIAVVISGENAIARVREIIGATDPADALRGTIRGDWAWRHRLPSNLVHASDSPEAADKEIKLWFS